MGWIKLTRNSNRSGFWVNTDHVTRAIDLSDKTRIYLTERNEKENISIIVSEDIDQVMSLIKGTGEELCRSLR